MLPTNGMAQTNPLMSRLLQMNSGLQIDLTQLEAVIQARRNAELAALSLSHQAPAVVEPRMPTLVPPLQPLVVASPQAPPRPPPPPPQQVPAEVDDLSSSESETEDSVARIAPPPQKRNPNDLNTAAPVTCMEDFMKLPISTKLNNLKLPKSSKGPVTAIPSRQPRVFSSNFLPRDHDVVVDMAHYPNREFQNLVRQSLPNYLTASQPKRKFLISAILSTVTGNGGSFLRFWGSRQAWAEVEKVHAEKYIAQALQDAASQQGTRDSLNASAAAAAAIKNGIHPNVAAAQNQKASPQPSKAVVSAQGLPQASVQQGNTKKRQRSSFSVGKRPSFRQQVTPKRSSFTALPRTSNEIPITFRKRPSQSIPATTSSDPDRSVLSIKFKRPRTSKSSRTAPSPTQPRKVSLETPANPLEFLSQIASASLDDEDNESEC